MKKSAYLLIILTLLLPSFVFAAIVDNFDSYSNGDLNGQGSWTAGASYDVEGTVVQAGAKAVQQISTGAGETASKAFGAGVTDGSQVFYVRRTGTMAGDYTWRMMEGGTRKIIMGVSTGRGFDGKFMYYLGGTGYQSTGVDFNTDTWYKIEIFWRSSDKKAQYWINGTMAVDWSAPIENFATNINGFLILDASTSGTFYIDSMSENIPSPSGYIPKQEIINLE